MINIRDVVESDFTSILRLNDAEVQQTSAMDLQRLGLLLGLSSYCKVATWDDQVVAFLLALRDGAAYENDNYAWFASRFARFLYVDRIVVDAQFSGRKIASKLYDAMFAYARSQGIATITCEYNLEPPNPASRAFHHTFGFCEVGTQWLAGGSKQVSLQAAKI